MGVGVYAQQVCGSPCRNHSCVTHKGVQDFRQRIRGVRRRRGPLRWMFESYSRQYNWLLSRTNRCATESDLQPRFQHVCLLHFQQEVSPVPDHHLGQLTKNKTWNTIFFTLIFLSVTRLSWHNAIKMVSIIIIKKVNFKPVTVIFKNPKNVYLLRRQKYDSRNKIRGQVPWKNVWGYQLKFCLAHQHLEERKGLKYICPYYFTINEVFLSLSTLFTLAPFSVKIFATSTLPFIDANI